MIVPDPPPITVPPDDILSETRRRKEAYAAEHGFDIRAIARDATHQAVASGVELTVRVVRADAGDEAARR